MLVSTNVLPKTADRVFVLLPNRALNIQYPVYYDTQALDKHVPSVKTMIFIDQ